MRAPLAVLLLLAIPAAAWADEPAPADGLRYGVHGYYRARYTLLEPGSSKIAFGPLSHLQQRLRIEPWATYGNREDPIARLVVQADLLDDVIWGDNAGVAPLPLFAADPSATGIDGAERPSFGVCAAG